MTDFVQFTVEASQSAFGIMSAVLGKEEDWDVLAQFPKTLVSLRRMPPNFQQEMGKPYLTEMLATLGFEADSPSSIHIAVAFDEVIASGLDDLMEMAMQAMQQQAMQSERARRALQSGQGSLLR